MSARRGFHLLWSSTAASNLADGMALVLLPLVALDGGADAAGVAVITVAATIAWPVLGLQAGWIVDRFPKRLILGVGNTARALAFGALAIVALLGDAPLWAVVAVALVYGIGETLVDTGINAAVPALVEPAGRTTANSRIEAAITVTNGLVGRPLAGLLVGLGLGLALGSVLLLYVTAAVLAIAIVALSAPRPSPDGPDAPAADGGDDGEPAPMRLRDGLAVLWGHPVLRSLTILTGLMNLAWAVFEALFIVYAVEPGPLGLPPAGYGVVLSLAAAGGILASVVTPWLSRRFPATPLFAVDTVTTVLLVLPIAAGAPIWVIVPSIVLASGGSTVWRILASSYRQQEVPERLLGRVYAAYRVISWGTLPLGGAIASIVAGVADVRTAFWVATGIALATCILFVVLLGRRRIELRRG